MDQLGTLDTSTADSVESALAVVDVDVHHAPSDVVSALRPYLSKTYGERLDDYGYVNPVNSYAFDGGTPGWVAELADDSDASSASCQDPQSRASRYLDTFGIDVAVLTGGPLYAVPTMTDLDYGSALCSAFNDWTLEHWVPSDARYRVCIAIDPQDPLAAASEIHRLGGHKRVCGVLLPSGSSRAYGQRFFDPIIDAAASLSLPLVIHVGGDGLGTLGDITPSGTPSFLIEERLATPGFVQGHLSSFIFEGVFSRHPKLRVAFLGAGFGWLPSYLWRMDEDWKGLRWSTPWVEDLPSKYVSQHIRIGTNPVADTAETAMVSSTLDWIDAKNTLMFASHYPEWDSAPPGRDLSDDRAMNERIYGTTAINTFRLGTSS